MSDIIKNYKGSKITLSESIKKQAFSKEEAKKAIDKIYEETSDIQKSFGKTVEDIMQTQGITKKWGKKTILDTARAYELTGLNRNVFQTNMYKSNCTIDMALIISMCIGFKLSPILTQRLLKSAGLDFRLDNPEHLAYIFLLEHCNDFNIDECNEILEYLGVPKTKQLGSYGRGGKGETLEYKPRKKK